MPIALTGGLVTLKAGLVSCSCCDACKWCNSIFVSSSEDPDSPYVLTWDAGNSRYEGYDSVGNLILVYYDVTDGWVWEWNTDGPLFSGGLDPDFDEECTPLGASGVDEFDDEFNPTIGTVTIGEDCACDSDETTYCITFDFGGGSTASYTVTGSLNDGEFYNVIGDDTYPFMVWNEASSRWQVSDGIGGLISDPFSGGSTDRCDPTGYGYEASGGWTASVTLGVCP